jgi:hypothetical protein
MEDVEHPTSSQPPSVGERAATLQRSMPGPAAPPTSTPQKQQHEEPTPTAEEPSATSGGIMGVVVVDKSGTRNLAIEAPTVEAAAVEEEAEINKIVRPKEENVAPQCVRVARKWGDEWVFYEEDHSDLAVHKLQRTIDDLMGQIKVRAPETQSDPIRLL